MSIRTGPSTFDGRAPALGPTEPAISLNLLDLYVRASVSADSLAGELGRYLNRDETTFSSSSKEMTRSDGSSVEFTIHGKALAAILEVVTSNSKATFECVRAPGPPGEFRNGGDDCSVDQGMNPIHPLVAMR